MILQSDHFRSEVCCKVPNFATATCGKMNAPKLTLTNFVLIINGGFFKSFSNIRQLNLIASRFQEV